MLMNAKQILIIAMLMQTARIQKDHSIVRAMWAIQETGLIVKVVHSDNPICFRFCDDS